MPASLDSTVVAKVAGGGLVKAAMGVAADNLLGGQVDAFGGLLDELGVAVAGQVDVAAQGEVALVVVHGLLGFFVTVRVV